MIAILTDSTCDIPDDLIEEFDIQVIPQYVIWGEEQFQDRIDLQPVDFYQRLVKDATRPTTSQATVGDFLNAIQHAVEKGASQSIILTVSSAMSGTFQMATTAAQKAPIPVTVIDSKGPSMSLGWQVLAAARARNNGADLADIVNTVKAVREQLVQVVAMETLEYLQKGGRIGDAAKWVGTLLKVRPVVSINHQTGRVEPAGLARTQKGAINMLCEKFFDRLKQQGQLRIAVLHGNAFDEAQDLAEKIRKEFDPVELLINITGPVLGINTGPGALALCGYSTG